MVGIENVVELEEDKATHGLVEKAVHKFETIGYILVAIWRLHNPSLSGYSYRKRAWLIFEPVLVSSRLPIFHQPVMDDFVGDLADCLLPVDQVSHLEIKGSGTVITSGLVGPMSWSGDEMWTWKHVTHF